ncbi:MAG: S8/S53 family peptidase [Alphaproteobacteria bacterium]|nr:S8/S53 family peptidase [Alphaproteobacteria bacterium]
MIYKKTITTIFVVFICFYSALSDAHKNKINETINAETECAHISIVPTCDVLPVCSANGVTIAPELTTPVQSLLNLAPVYQEGLSGLNQIGAVIEFGKPEVTPPGLHGVVLNIIESKLCEHPSMVSQVVSSRIKGIGIAPNARLFLGTKNSIIDGMKVTGIEDAIKLAIRAGAKAVNLSIKEKDFIFGEKDSLSADFLNGVRYALKYDIPVFIAAGNDKEILEESLFFKDIIEIESLSKDSLIVFATGFDYPNEAFDRDDLYFSSSYSARITSCNPGLKRHVLTAPSRVSAYCFNNDDPYEKDQFLLKAVKGTSFASPALMGVYLLLSEFSERAGYLASADIIACMRATAWKKEAYKENEEEIWYGCGVVDGGEALKACKLLVKARKLAVEEHCNESLDVWKEYLAILGHHVRLDYFIELKNIDEKCMQSNDFYEQFLSFWSCFYEGQSKDREQAFQLFEEGMYNECRESVNKIVRKAKTRKMLEIVLHDLIDLKIYVDYLSFDAGFKKFDFWLDSFIVCEKNEIIASIYKGLYNFEKAVPIFQLSMDVRNGIGIFSELLDVIEDLVEKKWFENCDDVVVQIIKERIEGLTKKLEQFEMPMDLFKRYLRLIIALSVDEQ